MPTCIPTSATRRNSPAGIMASSCPAPLCHAVGRLGGHIDNGIARVPRQTSSVRAEQRVGTNPRFFSVPLGSSHRIRPSPLYSRPNRRKQHGNRPRRHADLPCFIARASGAKGQWDKATERGARAESIAEQERETTRAQRKERGKAPARANPTRFFLPLHALLIRIASLPLALPPGLLAS